MSVTSTRTMTFTRTHAVYIGTKIAADLRQMSLFFGKPSDAQIADYLTEVVEFLLAGYLASVEYGFKRDGNWIASLRYEVRSDGTVADTGPGRVYARTDITGASFYSYLRHASAFDQLSSAARQAFKDKVPVKRTGANEPGHVDGYWESGKSYASGGVGAVRQQWRPR